MRSILFAISLILCPAFLFSQNPFQFENRIFLQSRFNHNPNYFTSGIESGIGYRAAINIYRGIGVHAGLTLNYANYGGSEADEGLEYFIDFFRRTEIHYFNFETVRQFHAEIPLGIQLDLLPNSRFDLGFAFNITPVLTLSSNARGTRFNEEINVKTNLLDEFFSDNFEEDEHYFFNGALIGGGLLLSVPVDDTYQISLESGWEMDNAGRSGGVYVKAGINF